MHRSSIFWLLSAALGCGSGSSARSDAGGGGVSPPSCAGAAGTACAGSSECCASPTVLGGGYYRSYDGLSTNGATKDAPATVSDFSLDKYEVTVARFRPFVSAVLAGWRPAAGAGKHAYLAVGGLNGGGEPGWDQSWNRELATSLATWNGELGCPGDSTWTPMAGPNEDHPVNCESWYEAYAFCIWDGGFLPSEAEWNYAAAGGNEQRLYPWSATYPPGSTTLTCQLANYSEKWPSEACVSSGTSAVGSYPTGDGRWGQSDLAGNVFEWTLDWYAPSYPSPCSDCANLKASSERVIRGGSFDGQSVCLLNSLRENSIPEGRSDGVGFRCARAPGG